MIRSATLIDIPVAIHSGDAVLHGDLSVPDGAVGLVAFANGGGSSRRSARNRMVARGLHDARLATLLMDLLTEAEAAFDIRTPALRFDVGLLSERVTAAVEWSATAPPVASLPIGLFGAGIGAAAALMVAAGRPELIGAVVSRGGRVDLAGEALGLVKAPTLLIVGGADEAVRDPTRRAYEALICERRLSVVPGVTHLFEEPGALEQVARLAAEWFTTHLAPTGAPRAE